MKIIVLAIGKTSYGFIREGLAEYNQRSARLIDLEWVEIPDPRNSGKLPPAEVKLAEEAILLKQLKGQDGFYLLDENGKEYDSVEFARFLEEKMLGSQKQLILIIGGAYGFSPTIQKMAKGKLSLSKMTFSHQLVRLILAEQVYRGLSIIRGLPYHNP